MEVHLVLLPGQLTSKGLSEHIWKMGSISELEGQ